MKIVKTRNNLFLLVSIFVASSPLLAEMDNISYATYTLHQNALAVEHLHRLKIDRTESVIQSLERTIESQIGELSLLSQNENLSKLERNRIKTQLVLIAVMQTKLDLKQGEQPPEVRMILAEILEERKEEYARFECFDWTEPMWSSDSLENCE